jgi:hypothetical protein
MTDQIDIPAIAWEIKALFPPVNDAIVAEIKAYVKAHGTPHLWCSHTHSPPAKDGKRIFRTVVCKGNSGQAVAKSSFVILPACFPQSSFLEPYSSAPVGRAGQSRLGKHSEAVERPVHLLELDELFRRCF